MFGVVKLFWRKLFGPQIIDPVGLCYK